MAAVTKSDLERDVMELRGQLLRTELLNETLRRRNGELYVALSEVDPEAASSITDTGTHLTRYVVLDRIVERATQLALKASGFPEVIDEELDALVEAVMANEGYWRRVEEEREQRKNQAAKAAQTKREKEAANGH